MADVQLVKVELSVPKELAEVRDLVVQVAKDIKGGMKPVEVVYDAFPKLQGAIEGLAQVPAELKSKEVYALGAVLVADLLAIFLAPKVVTAAADAAAAVATPAVAPAAEGAAAPQG